MASTSTPARVLLVGATGLVGQQALLQLLARNDVAEVRALVRRDVTPAQLLGCAPDLVEGVSKLHICKADFNRLEAHVHWFDVDWVFCALGTTIKQAGSQSAFRQVDFDYALQIAQLAKAEGVRRFLLVSALGANVRSGVFYNRVKGELEEAIKAIGFEHVSIAQPSLLVGERAQVRLGERIGLKFGFLMPARYKPVHVAQVAAGLIASGAAGKPGWHVLDNISLRRML